MATYSNGTVKTTSSDTSVNPPVLTVTMDFAGPPPIVGKQFEVAQSHFINLAGCRPTDQVDVETQGTPETVIRVTVKKV